MTTALTIAGSDPTGGAGIQADLQTFASLGVHGAAAVTALTVQDTRAVHACQPLASEQVAEQLRALLADVCVAAAKTGMLAGADTVHVVARHLTESSTIPLVVDPVTVSTSGRALLTPEGVDALRDVILPRATLVTPNLAEAEALTGLRIASLDDMRLAGECLLELGAGAAMVKGGHSDGDPIDVFVDADGHVELAAERVPLRVAAHGTGCVLSAAITALLARDVALRDAVAMAKEYLTEGLRHARYIGDGAPVINFDAASRALDL